MRVYLIAGESSGDVLGSLLMKALRAEAPGAMFYGVGGPLMEREGLHSLFPMGELSVMGLVEVLPKLKSLIGRIREVVAHIGAIQPDMVVTIDAPDFSFRVAKGLRTAQAEGGDFPLLVHYVAPTVWAWRAGRAKKVSKLYDGVLCLYPFEPPYFQKHGMAAGYVGHPVMEQGYAGASEAALRAELGIAPDAPVMGLLFGSRTGEVERHGPVLHEAALRLQKNTPGLHFAVPTLPHVEKILAPHLAGLERVHVSHDQSRKPEMFAAMNAAVAVSGTVALELAVANVPHVIAYRMNGLTWQIIRRVVRVRYAHLANILLNKMVVPEFLQEDCEADAITPAVKILLKDGREAETQEAEFATVRKLLNGKTKDAPSVQAARFIVDLYNQKRPSGFVPYAKNQRLPIGT